MLSCLPATDMKPCAGLAPALHLQVSASSSSSSSGSSSSSSSSAASSVGQQSSVTNAYFGGFMQGWSDSGSWGIAK